MRDFIASTSELELLPTTKPESSGNDGSHDRQALSGYKHSDSKPRTKAYAFWQRPGIRYIFCTLPLAAAIVPIAVLIAYSSTLSFKLSHNGCTPSGEFVLPYSISIWDWSRFFTISAAFNGGSLSSCSYSSEDSFSLECVGYSFTQVKVIDIAWDILVGRGGQAVLTIFAYQLFSRILKMLMENGEVGYDAFSAVAFKSGTLTSLVTLIRHVGGWTPIPRTRHAIYAYTGMALATLNVVAAPSLVAAMTGYTSYYAPFLDYSLTVNSTQGLQDCGGIILPVWGRVQQILPYDIENGESSVIDGSVPIVYDSDYAWINAAPYGPEYIEYYHRYRTVYNACPSKFNISTCPAANQKTYIIRDWEPEYDSFHNSTIISPMPGVIPYSPEATSPSKSSHWLCGMNIVTTDELTQYAPSANTGSTATGICRAGNGYAWGFSFMMTFVVCVLNLIFVLIMYALWFDVYRHDAANKEVGEFKDAVTMVTSAQKQYGEKLSEWNSEMLQRLVVKGKVGITFGDDSGLRKRAVAIENEYRALGHPHMGDWGGDVAITDTDVHGNGKKEPHTW